MLQKMNNELYVWGLFGIFPHVYTAYTIFSIKVLYNLATLCLSATFSCVDFKNVIMGDIPVSLCVRCVCLTWGPAATRPARFVVVVVVVAVAAVSDTAVDAAAEDEHRHNDAG